MYFIVQNNDGDTTVEQLTKESLMQKLNDGDYDSTGFISKLKDCDTNYCGDNILIIKGDIVTPEAIKTVEEYTIK